MESLDADYSHAADSGSSTNNFSDGGMYQKPKSMDDQYLSTSREYDSETINDDDRHSPDSYTRTKGSIISKMVHRSMDDSGVSDLRMSRLAQAEAAMRQEIFKECTFRPQIKDLPASYGSRKKDDIPFTARVEKWQNERNIEMKAKSTLITQGRLAECTFHPKINDNSEKAAKVLRGPESMDRLRDRLHKSSEALKQQRDQLDKQKSAKEAMDFEQQGCTFKPDLATKHAAVHQQSSSKFSIIIDKPSSSEQMTPYELRDCTFTPKINKIKPNMSSAKLYISSDVVDRLTRPIASSGSVEDSSQQQQQRFDSTSPSGRSSRPGVMNIQSFLGSLQGSAIKASAPSSGSGAQQSPQMSSDEKLKRQLKFESFLNRQKAIMKRKEEQIQQIQRATTPKFRPTITKRAQQEVGGVVDGSSFMKRNEADIQKRIAKEQQQEVVSQLDENCTFRPHIQSSRKGSSSSAGQRSRSAFELSHGDALRKETNRRMLKLKNDQEELQHMTFQPKISDYAKEVSGRLQINNEQTQFLEFLKQENMKKEAKRLEVLRLREEQEAKSCTFSPQTTDCPAYIKRIAKSMSIVKAARNSTSGLLDNSNMKPDWK